MAKGSRFQAWSDLLSRHPEPHLVVGWTCNVNRWRDEGFFDLIDARQPVGRYAVKRDFDEKRSQYLVLAAFEHESDARDLTDAADTETTRRYPGYASQREFKYGGKFGAPLKAASKQ